MQIQRRNRPGRPALLLIWIAATSEVFAHPTSHVDAWVRADETLNVRVVVVLHDALTYQGVDFTDDTLIPSEEIRTALGGFGETLLEQIQLYDETGHRLQGTVVQRPDWQPNSEGVFLSDSATLRLSWQLEYPWYPQGRSLTIRHGFEPRADSADVGDEPGQCELRFHLQHRRTGRRIDSVIPSHRFHTIALPDDSERTIAQSNSSTCRADLILIPGSVTHEFTLPLTDLENVAWTGTRVEDDRADVFPRVHARETLDQIHQWIETQLEIRIDGNPIPCVTLVAEFLTPQQETIVDSAVPLAGTQLGIRTVHTAAKTPESFEARWKFGLGEASSLMLSVTTSTGTITRSTLITHGDSRLLGATEAVYRWDRSKDGLPAERPATDELAPEPEEAGIWRVNSRDVSDRKMPPIAAVVFALSLVVAYFAGWANIRTSAPRRVLAIVVVTGIAAAAATLWESGPDSRVPDDDGMLHRITQILNRIYSSTALTSDVSVIDNLSDVLTEELTEHVYLEIASSVLAPLKDGPMIRIYSVNVTNCRVTGFQADHWVTADCAWQVSGSILHWGHLHDRQIRISAAVKLRSTGELNRMDEIHVTDVQTSTPEEKTDPAER